MSNLKGIGLNNIASGYDPSMFAVSNGILTKYLGHSSIVEIPDGIDYISSSAFMGCLDITEITIPDSVKGMDSYSFVSCAALKTIKIGFGVSTIPMGAFAELPNLESVVMTDNITTIDDFAFRNCKALNSLKFLTKKYRDPITVEEKGKLFEIIVSGGSAKIEYVDYMDAPPILASIGNYAFYGCLSLDVTILKANTKKIGFNSFDDCISETNNCVEKKPLNDDELSDMLYCSDDDTFVEINNTSNVDSLKSDGIEENSTEHKSESTEDDAYLPKYLIQGFSVADDKILNDTTLEIIPDAPIENLSLSNRSYNALYRIKRFIGNDAHDRLMVSDLLKINPEQLLRVRNMGTKSTEEIIAQLTAYLHSDSHDEPIIDNYNTITIAPGYEVKDNIITHIDSGYFVEDILIEYIGLGVRAVNSLHRGQVNKLSELIGMTTQQLSTFPQMGIKSINEILSIVPEYLKENRVETLTVESTETETDNPVVSLPPINMECVVLAPDYAVVDGIIYHRKSLKIIDDIPIEDMDLSVRALNCLKHHGNAYVSSLIGMRYDDFRNIRNLGLLSANEIIEKLERYLEIALNSSEKCATPAVTASPEEVLEVLHNFEFTFVNIDFILQSLPDATEEDVQAVLTKLVSSKKIDQNDESYAIHHVSFSEDVFSNGHNDSLQIDDRAIRILRERISGKTLEELGQSEGATRERVRQIEKKAFDKFTRRGHTIYDEDRYAHLFTTYAFEKEFYFDYLGVEKDVWYYLNMRYIRGDADVNDALEDDDLSPTLRRAIDKYIHRDCFLIDGNYIPLQRGDIENIVVEKYCKDEVTLDQFFEYYESFLSENSITDERLQLTESVKASRSNRLAESNCVLWKQNKCLRYYDIDGSDFTELLETLNLEQYDNVELSTRKFLIDFPDLMKHYDLRDEYEIHNLLKKIHAEKMNPHMVFGRMPSIQFGVFDKDNAVKEMLFALAPISADALAEMLSNEYGTRVDTIKANWFSCISEYYHQGMYSIEYEDMPDEQVQKLKSVLTDDFYFLTELQKVYKGLFCDADLSLLSTYNLKKMGFIVGSSYVLQHYSSAESYFEYLLTTDDIVDVAPISKRYTGLTTYSAYLSSIKHERIIIEFEPYQYINIRRLEKLGFTKEKLSEYGSEVWSYLVDDNYFTVQSLRNDGFASELDVLGFGDLFYASILKEDERFAWQRVGSAIVFNPKGNSFTVHDFLVDYVNKVGSVNIDDFSFELKEKFGINLDRSSIVEKVKGSEVYYDSIMEKLYADYSLYFEEI